MNFQEKLLDSFIAFEQDVDLLNPIHSDRKEALKRFEKQGFPSKKDESWKYTSLKSIIQKDYSLSSKPNKSVELRDVKEYFLNDLDSFKIVFIDGVYQFESTYTVNGAVVTFTTAPPIATDNVQIVHTLANVISFVGTAATVVETAGAATCDFQAADIFNLTIDEATTLTFTNPQLANTKNIVITGNHAVTLPASVREISGGSVTATGITLIQVTCVDAITPVYYATIGTA